MLKFVKNYDYKEEKVNLIAGYNDDKCVASMCELLHIDKEDVKGVTSFFTAGKLSFKKLYLVDLSNIKDSNDLIPIFKKIAAIEEDIKILADTFKKNFELEDIVSSLTETLTTTTYSFDELKSTKQQKKEYTVEIYSKDDMEEYFQKGIIYGEGINQARDLVNKPYNYLNATDLANIATKLGKEANIEVTVYNKEQIEELNMGMFLAVNKGSYDEPKLIVMKYQGLDTFENPCALVGKGVMFDTGGYSLKSPVSMPGMKTDMAGAAAVINAISIIARRKRKANVMAVVAATDNRIDSLAIVPDDIITSMNGKTVEIKSTDAEGRLTLGDAVWFAQTKEHAKKVIDVATLTGAIVSALGNMYTGAFTNNPKFLEELKAASDKSNEPIWEMPVNKKHHDLIKSNIADIRNSGGKTAGSSTAAAFIEEFIQDDIPWIHLDIAGTSFDSQKRVPTGVMVKTLATLFE